jgi:Cu-Zn family superoxide dismutase
MSQRAICILDPRVNHGISGYVEFTQNRLHEPTRIDFKLKGFLPLAVHAVHIHEYGDLSEGCKSLGAHFNPMGTQHGAHAGDLFYNLQADPSGQFEQTFYSPHISLFGTSKHCVIGRSIVIHQFRDDLGSGGWTHPETGIWIPYSTMSNDQLRELSGVLGYPSTGLRKTMLQKLEHESLTTGNASTRIACAVIGFAKPS